MFPSIPDSLYKFLVLIGVVLFGYSIITEEVEKKNYVQQLVEYNSDVRRLDYQKEFFKEDLELLAKDVSEYAGRMGVKNPLTKVTADYDSSQLLYIKTYKGSKEAMAVSDSMDRLVHKYYSMVRVISSKDKELSVQRYKVEMVEKNFKEANWTIWGCRVLGAIIFFIGVGKWIDDDWKKQRRELALVAIEQRKLGDAPIVKENCQSCGRQFNGIVKRGNEADGKVNYSFCTDCFLLGQYTDPELSLTSLIARTTNEQKSKGISSQRIAEIVKHLRWLDRWYPNKYR